jgi:hypothetical protein
MISMRALMNIMKWRDNPEAIILVRDDNGFLYNPSIYLKRVKKSELKDEYTRQYIDKYKPTNEYVEMAFLPSNGAKR